MHFVEHATTELVSAVSEHAALMAFLFACTNAPMGVAQLWRRLKRVDRKSTLLGFEGPVICTILLLVAAFRPPFPWWLLLLPWIFHFGTWIVLRDAARWLGASLRRRSPRL